eukprot:TRINITY_DN2664_c1_g1_i1.p1 TRINITY_DN2664_c1_g1~~TRINITY_DN2664_c1_g1_i1.p1  ORF type:complete len:330 (-),score=91.68 TRINITY_DN2664_c1_g1_i1:27-1016(-)
MSVPKGMESRVAEGDKYIKEGDKHAKKSFFHSPDWDNAGVFYEKAVNCYRSAKAFEQTKDALKKASNAAYQNPNGTTYTAAKHLQEAAKIARDQKQIEEAVELFVQATNLYREDGKAVSAADAITDAAKLLDDKDPERSMELLKQALEILEIDDKEAYSGDTFQKTISLLLKHKKYKDVIEVYQSQCRALKKLTNPHDLNKAILSMIIIYLYCDDVVQARKVYQENMDFYGSDAGRAASDLLDAFENRDPEKLAQLTQFKGKFPKHAIFNNLYQGIMQIVQNGLKVSESLVSENPVTLEAPPPPYSPTAPPSSSSTTTTTTTTQEDELL